MTRKVAWAAPLYVSSLLLNLHQIVTECEKAMSVISSLRIEDDIRYQQGQQQQKVAIAINLLVEGASLEFVSKVTGLNLLAEGASPEFISKITGLTLEQLRQLQWHPKE